MFYVISNILKAANKAKHTNSMDITIKEMRTRSELKKFTQFGIELYKNNPYFCPPIIIDEINTLSNDTNPAFEVCESVYYIAFQDKKPVGRIAGIINSAANNAWQVKKLRFGWFDFINNLEVSKALLDAVVEWGRKKGMTQMNGPVGFTDFDHQGLLLEGFEHLSPMASLYNYPYYEQHYDAYGLKKDADWIEIRSGLIHEMPERVDRLCKAVEQRYNVKIEYIHSKKELIKRFGYTFFDVIDSAYSPLYNYSPLTRSQKHYYAKMFFPLLNYDFISLITNDAGELVAVGVCMPNITPALRKTKGKLFPFGWISILKALKAKQFDQLDFLLIAVRPDYQNKGINSLFFKRLIPSFKQYGVKYSESSAILETNNKSQAHFDFFDSKQHKRRRAYIKDIAE